MTTLPLGVLMASNKMSASCPANSILLWLHPSSGKRVFPKIRGTLMIVFLGLYWGPPLSGNHPISEALSPRSLTEAFGIWRLHGVWFIDGRASAKKAWWKNSSTKYKMLKLEQGCKLPSNSCYSLTRHFSTKPSGL